MSSWFAQHEIDGTAPIDKGSCIGRIVQDLDDHRFGWLFPEQLPFAQTAGLVARQQDMVRFEKMKRFQPTPQLCKGREDQRDTPPDLFVRDFFHSALCCLHQTSWQVLNILATSNLAESACI